VQAPPLILVPALLLGCWPVCTVPGQQPPRSTREARHPLARGGSFVENAGQWDPRILFVWRGRDYVAHFERDGVRLAKWRQVDERHTEGCVLWLQFLGSGALHVEGEDVAPALCNFFLGNDPRRWKTGVHSFGEVVYGDLYPGIDVRFREVQGRLEYDINLAPGALLSDVRVHVEGEAVAAIDDGALSLGTSCGPLLQRIPAAWVVGASGERSSVGCRFVALGKDTFGFDSPAVRLNGLPLVIDPSLEWSTYLGGSSEDIAFSVGVVVDGDLIVVGTTTSADFPTTSGVFQASMHTFGDLFITRMTADGQQIVWSTYLGGSNGFVSPFKAAVSPAGETTIIGRTLSQDFPITPGAFETTPPPVNGTAGFVTRLAADGASLVYSTFLGQGGDTQLNDLALHSDGSVVVAGWAGSFAWPTTPGAYKSVNDMDDAFVTRLNAQGTGLVASTLLGASSGPFSSFDGGTAVAIAPNGEVTVAGWTQPVTALFPTTPGAFSRTFHGGYADAFVTRLDPAFHQLVWSTLLGGNGMDTPQAIALTPTGSVVVAGYTSSRDFPTTPGVVAPQLNAPVNGQGNGFITRLDPTGSSLEFSTLLTTSTLTGGDIGWMALDSADDVLVVGNTGSTFPTTPGARDPTFNGGFPWGDVFVTKLDPRGQRYVYSSFLGGSDNDFANGAALLPSGSLAIVGWTSSSSFPTTPGAYQTQLNGPSDAFIAVEQLLPTGAARYGASTPSCTGPLTIDVSGMPVAGDPQFALCCRGAPANGWGYLLLGTQQDLQGSPFFGATLHVGVPGPSMSLLSRSNMLGAVNKNVPIPPGLQGLQVYGQFLWPMPPSCGLQALVAASNALDLTVQ
jgi:hypothetical protein